MTQEDKELLLRDLSARLTYGVIVDYKENEFEFPHWKITTIHPDTFDGWIGYYKRVGAGSESGSRPFKIESCKPYLRPMSSMTEEEMEELKTLCSIYIPTDSPTIGFEDYGIVVFTHHLTNNTYSFKLNVDVIDWLNKKMFDYRGLISMGLALEAPEGMYRKEDKL